MLYEVITRLPLRKKLQDLEPRYRVAVGHFPGGRRVRGKITPGKPTKGRAQAGVTSLKLTFTVESSITSTLSTVAYAADEAALTAGLVIYW